MYYNNNNDIFRAETEMLFYSFIHSASRDRNNDNMTKNNLIRLNFSPILLLPLKRFLGTDDSRFSAFLIRHGDIDRRTINRIASESNGI